MPKTYLRYKNERTFNTISSGTSNIVLASNGHSVIVGANEMIIVWNAFTGAQEKKFINEEKTFPINSIAVSKNLTQQSEVMLTEEEQNMQHFLVAGGYSDGSISIFDFKTTQVETTFHGHNSEVTSLIFNHDDSLLVSGGKDTFIIVWDIVSQTGMFKLSGHKGEITNLKFHTFRLPLPGVTRDEEDEDDDSKYTTQTLLLSSSKDSLIKVWDHEKQFCVDTLTGFSYEVWDFDICDNLLVAGSIDNELKIWKLEQKEVKPRIYSYATYTGTLPRTGKERVMGVAYHSDANLLAVHSGERALEIFKVNTEKEAKMKQKRRRKRRFGKLQQEGEAEEPPTTEELTVFEEKISDYFKRLLLVTTESQIKNVTFLSQVIHTQENNYVYFVIEMASNSLEMHCMDMTDLKKAFSKCLKSLTLSGHRGAPKCVNLSSNDELMLSTSNESLKVWRVGSGECTKTIACRNIINCVFLPGDSHALAGTKDGSLLLIDLKASTIIQEVEEAHDGAIWSTNWHNNPEGEDSVTILTGGADKALKFWKLAAVTLRPDESISGQVINTIKLQFYESMTMLEEVIHAKYSPSGKFFAAALGDFTIKVYYSDSKKFFLSLYGHKLTALSFDVSDDNTLLASGGADKNLKLWGMDFGDCHKSIFAHDSTITQVKFVPSTHYIFTTSKDTNIKYWDGDTYNCILTLNAHFADVWCLAMSSIGDFVISGSNDKSIRVWRQTTEQVFLEEEREMHFERLIEESTLKQAENNTGLLPDISTARIDIEGMDQSKPESSRTLKRTMENLKLGERVSEAVELAKKDKEEWQQYEYEIEEFKKAEQERKTMSAEEARLMKLTVPAKPEKHAMMMGKDADTFLISQLKIVRAPELENTLNYLTFEQAKILLQFLDGFLKNGREVELSSRILFCLMEIFFYQITASNELVPVIDSLNTNLRKQLRNNKDTIGFNVAGLKYLHRELQFYNITKPEDETV